MYISRSLENRVINYLKAFPVTALGGPRQSGKSTMLKHMLGNNYDYVTFDDYRMIDLVESDPEKLIATYNDKVIFDEAQKAPGLFDLVKRMVDEDRQNYGKFILTGSSQFLLNQKITETLAGRVGLLHLLPLSYHEIPAHLHKQSIYLGGYPELIIRDYENHDLWWSSYINTYVERDVKNLDNIGNLRDFRRLIELLAARVAQTLNMSELANDLGVSVPTIKRWISVLEASYIIYLLPPYFKNYGKRITKSPKIYFYDTGLVSFLTGTDSSELFEKGPLNGPIFENYFLMEIMKKNEGSLYYWRTHSGQEVDLIIDKKSHKVCFEIKAGYSYKSKMLEHIESFKEENDEFALIYRGETLAYAPVFHYGDYLDKF